MISGVKAAIATLKATRCERFFAKHFGKQIKQHEGFAVVTLSRWRGKYYLVNMVDSDKVCTCESFPQVHCRYCAR